MFCSRISRPLAVTTVSQSEQKTSFGRFSNDDFFGSETQSPRAKLSKCSLCRSFSYCNRNCQTLDWKEGHKHECAIYAADPEGKLFKEKASGDESESDNMVANRLFLRVYLKLFKDSKLATAPYKIYDGTTRCFEDLKDHMAQYLREQTAIPISSGIQVALQKFGLFDLDLAKKVRCKIQSNMAAIRSGDTAIGAGIYIESSFFSHSCVPNAATAQGGIRKVIYADRNIPSSTGVFISYLNVQAFKELSPAERKNMLQKMLFTPCTCLMCRLGDQKELELRKKMKATEEKRARHPLLGHVEFDDIDAYDKLKTEYELCVEEYEVLAVSGKDPLWILTLICMARIGMLLKRVPVKSVKTDGEFMVHFREINKFLKVDDSRFSDAEYFQLITDTKAELMANMDKILKLRNAV